LLWNTVETSVSMVPRLPVFNFTGFGFHTHFNFWTTVPGGTRNNLCFSAISDSSAGSTSPRRGKARSEMESHHLVLGRPLCRFPVSVAIRTCLAHLSWDILATWPKTNVAGISRIGERAPHSGLYEFHSCTLGCEVSPQTYHKNPVSAACANSIISVITQDS